MRKKNGMTLIGLSVFCTLCLAFVVGLRFVPGSPAFASSTSPLVSPNPDCNAPDAGSYTRIDSDRLPDGNSGHVICFNQTGYNAQLSKNISNVWVLRAGSYSGWILYYDGNGKHKLAFSPHNEYPLPNVYVTQVNLEVYLAP